MSEWVVLGTLADLEAAGRLVARVGGREVGVVWDRERRAYVDAHDGTWTEKATRKMQGMSSAEWASYLRDKLGAHGEVGEISAAVAEAIAPASVNPFSINILTLPAVS